MFTLALEFGQCEASPQQTGDFNYATLILITINEL